MNPSFYHTTTAGDTLKESFFSSRGYLGKSASEEKIRAKSYTYGFNGMESDEEIAGQGNSYTTEFRQYDPRLGRWMSIDPLFASFPWQSPYVAFDNNPILYKDPRGLAAEGGNADKKKDRAVKKFGKKVDRLMKKNPEMDREDAIGQISEQIGLANAYPTFKDKNSSTGNGYTTYDIGGLYAATQTDLTRPSNSEDGLVTQDLVETDGRFSMDSYTTAYQIEGVPGARSADLVITNHESVPGQVEILGDNGGDSMIPIGGGTMLLGPNETRTVPINTNVTWIQVSESVDRANTTAKFTLKVVSNTSDPNRFNGPKHYSTPVKPSREEVIKFFNVSGL